VQSVGQKGKLRGPGIPRVRPYDRPQSIARGRTYCPRGRRTRSLARAHVGCSPLSAKVRVDSRVTRGPPSSGGQSLAVPASPCTPPPVAGPSDCNGRVIVFFAHRQMWRARVHDYVAGRSAIRDSGLGIAHKVGLCISARSVPPRSLLMAFSPHVERCASTARRRSVFKMSAVSVPMSAGVSSKSIISD
jgi:hypothetical protein